MNNLSYTAKSCSSEGILRDVCNEIMTLHTDIGKLLAIKSKIISQRLHAHIGKLFAIKIKISRQIKHYK